MSKVYGLKLGTSVGLEYESRDARDKAIQTFTHGSSVSINSSGVVYRDGENAFSTYERDPSRILVRCFKCGGTFDISDCPEREYPFLTYSGKWTADAGHICDGCLEEAKRKKEVADAKAVLGNNEE